MRTLTSQDLVIVELPRHQPPGHEQEGYCPAVVVGVPERLGTPKPELAEAVVVGVPERLGTPRYPVQSGPWARRKGRSDNQAALALRG